MDHQYSKFTNKNIPYAKVRRRVFISLFNAEAFCSEHGLNVDSAIEYGENPELKRQCEEIAKYQKAILHEVMEQLDKQISGKHEEIHRLSAALDSCHQLDRGYLEKRLQESIGESTATHEAWKLYGMIKRNWKGEWMA